jgi:hypothetical protein
MVQQPQLDQGLLVVEASRSHSDTPHSVGLLWTSDQPDAETSNWQHTTHTTERHPCPRRVSNPQPGKRAAADPRLRPRGRWARRWSTVTNTMFKTCIYLRGKNQQQKRLARQNVLLYMFCTTDTIACMWHSRTHTHTQSIRICKRLRQKE